MWPNLKLSPFKQPEKGVLIAKKNEKTLSVRRHKNGTITIESESFSEKIQIRAQTPRQKYDTVREAILAKGYVFTGKIEKMVRKEVNFWD